MHTNTPADCYKMFYLEYETSKYDISKNTWINFGVNYVKSSRLDRTHFSGGLSYNLWGSAVSSVDPETCILMTCNDCKTTFTGHYGDTN